MRGYKVQVDIVTRHKLAITSAENPHTAVLRLVATNKDIVENMSKHNVTRVEISIDGVLIPDWDLRDPDYVDALPDIVTE